MSNDNLVIKWGQVAAINPGVLNEKDFSATAGREIPGETAFPLTVVFDGAQVGLRVQPPQVAEPLDDTNYAVWTGAIRIPVEVQWEKPDTWFKSDLRFFVSKDEGARALLVADLGRETVMREFPYEQKLEAEEISQTTFHRVLSRPVRAYAATFLLIVERRDLESAVDLRIDSLDVEINPNFRA